MFESLRLRGMQNAAALTLLSWTVVDCGQAVDDAPFGVSAIDAGDAEASSRDGGSGIAEAGGSDVGSGIAEAGAAGDGRTVEGGSSEAEAAAASATAGAVDPAVSKNWSWQACGAIPPTPLADQVQFLSDAGELVVSYEDGSILVHAPGGGPAVRQLVAPNGRPAPRFGLSLDGALLARSGGTDVRVVSTVDGSELHRVPEPGACSGGALQFSAEGDYLLETGGQTMTCVWRMADNSLIAETASRLASAAIRAGQLYTVENGTLPDGSNQVAIVAYSLPTGSCGATCPAPAHATSVSLQSPPGWSSGWSINLSMMTTRISPRGDSLASWASDTSGASIAALWRLDGSLAFSSSTQRWAPTAYATSGTRVLLGDRVIAVDNATAESELSDQALANISYATPVLDNSGQLVAVIDGESADPGQIALYDLPAGHAVQVVGAMPPASPSGAPTDIAVSEDGSWLLFASVHWSHLWHLDPDFAASTIVSVQHLFAMDGRFSPDGSALVLSGDGMSVARTDTGDLLSLGLPPAPNVPDLNCFVVGARFSPRGDRLLVGGYQSYVLDVASNTVVSPLPTLTCNARAVYSQDGTLVATSDPRLYRASDWSPVWTTTRDPGSPPNGLQINDLYDDVQFRPHANELLVSHASDQSIMHALYSLSDGSLVRALPELQSVRAKMSPEGNWVVSGSTLLHLPDGEVRTFDPDSVLATFAPNGDIIALLADHTLARYCRTN